MKYDYLVVGAGLFGAVFAQQAKKCGKRILVIDKRDHIGGNIYTEEIEGIQVHKYGAHIFHTNDTEVWEYVNQFASFNRFTNSPVANYKGNLIPFYIIDLITHYQNLRYHLILNENNYLYQTDMHKYQFLQIVLPILKTIY